MNVMNKSRILVLGVRVLPALSWVQNGILMHVDVSELFVVESAWLFRQG